MEKSIRYYENQNGKKQYETKYYLDGKKDEIYYYEESTIFDIRKYNESGKLTEYLHYYDVDKLSSINLYYESGRISEDISYHENGTINILSRYYDNNNSTFYDDRGAEKESFHYSSDGKLLSECKGKEDGCRIYFTIYYENGNIKQSFKYHDNGKIQEKTDYYENGNISELRKYYENGNIKEEIVFDKNGTTRIHRFYDENGNRIPG